MSDYPGVTKEELEQDVAPVVRKWLENTNRVKFGANGHDGSDHKVYTHGASDPRDAPSNIREYYDATVVYEGFGWVFEFIEDVDGGLDVGDRTYEVEQWSSYEMVVRILDDYREEN